ncbi:hypothetical protein I553_9934 [Mycobacterium xenopi 4042]|uniref:Uncharacterized protein n=1 Tax=Mycobacterium xenopi 4042 TaxID=1299334 RepID=X7YNV6_MYCXE|nr:hypothetical protein I553_9934 [Mycobacterium xenopi 4042]
MVLMTGSGCADARPAPAVSDNATAPTAVASLGDKNVTIYEHLSTNSSPDIGRRSYQLSVYTLW